MRITRAEFDMLLRRQAREGPVPSGRTLPGEIELYLPGILVNPLNATSWGWRKRRAWAEEWRNKVAAALLAIHWRRDAFPEGHPWHPRSPKAITITARVARRFDSQDNLRAACKPIPDGLVACGVIHNDSDRSGHRFMYAQEIDRALRGAVVTVQVVRPTEAP